MPQTKTEMRIHVRNVCSGSLVGRWGQDWTGTGGERGKHVISDKVLTGQPQPGHAVVVPSQVRGPRQLFVNSCWGKMEEDIKFQAFLVPMLVSRVA